METIESFAARLNGREYGAELLAGEIAEARAAGFLVAFGASDDLLELRGVADEELGAWEGGSFGLWLDGKELRPLVEIDNEDDVREAGWRPPETVLTIKAEWDPKDLPGTSWRITADKPFAPFNVTEDGEVYCVGAVIALPGPQPQAPQGAPL